MKRPVPIRRPMGDDDDRGKREHKGLFEILMPGSDEVRRHSNTIASVLGRELRPADPRSVLDEDAMDEVLDDLEFGFYGRRKKRIVLEDDPSSWIRFEEVQRLQESLPLGASGASLGSK